MHCFTHGATITEHRFGVVERVARYEPGARGGIRVDEKICAPRDSHQRSCPRKSSEECTALHRTSDDNIRTLVREKFDHGISAASRYDRRAKIGPGFCPHTRGQR